MPRFHRILTPLLLLPAILIAGCMDDEREPRPAETSDDGSSASASASASDANDQTIGSGAAARLQCEMRPIFGMYQNGTWTDRDHRESFGVPEGTTELRLTLHMRSYAVTTFEASVADPKGTTWYWAKLTASAGAPDTEVSAMKEGHWGTTRHQEPVAGGHTFHIRYTGPIEDLAYEVEGNVCSGRA